MPLDLSDLEKGIAYWHHNTKWPRDFHNDFYQKMARMNPQGQFGQVWWDQFLKELHRWRATRPCSHAVLTERAQQRFQLLAAKWTEVIIPHLAEDIEEVSWDDISEFPRIVSEIKNVDSPVFSSKFCHFLAPTIFPVVDNAAMDNRFNSYHKYFSTAKQEWYDTDNNTKRALLELITNEIGSSIHPNYPKKCKIIELCFIGRKNNVQLAPKPAKKQRASVMAFN